MLISRGDRFVSKINLILIDKLSTSDFVYYTGNNDKNKHLHVNMFGKTWVVNLCFDDLFGCFRFRTRGQRGINMVGRH